MGQTRMSRVLEGLRLAGPRLAMVLVGGLIGALAGALLIAAFGRAVLGVPGNLQELKMPGIVPYAFPPIVGCTGGFIVAFIVKKPGPRSIHLFYTVGVKFALLDSLIAVFTLPGSPNVGTIVTVVAVIVYPLLVMPVLLRFVPRPGVPAADSSRVQTVPVV